MVNRAALTKREAGRTAEAPERQAGPGYSGDGQPPGPGVGQCFLHLCRNVQQTTIRPWITQAIQQGSTVNTDEYSIYARLSAWGYVHVTVNHSEGEYARDADGDGVNEVHVNTMEGVWSLLRSWLRPYRGISQRFLPLYIGFFQTMHNIR